MSFSWGCVEIYIVYFGDKGTLSAEGVIFFDKN